MILEFAVVRSLEEFAPVVDSWDALTSRSGTPYLSGEWVLAWWRGLGSPGRNGVRTFVLLGRDPAGTVRAGAFLQRRSADRLVAASDVHSTDWDVVADSDTARRACWQEVVCRGGRRLHLPGLTDVAARTATEELTATGHAVVRTATEANPRQHLPATWEDLCASVTRKLRSRLRQLDRGLRAAGALRFRTTRGGPTLERDLAAFFDLEASGWKGREGTAILTDPRTTTLYREFALGASARERLRLHLLELDGQLIAGDLGWVSSGGAFVIKTTYCEDHARLSPGLVLRAEVLRASIEEGCRFYDFLGAPQPWKLRWGAVPATRWTVDGYRGAWRPVATYRTRVRPLLKTCRDQLLRH